MVIYDPYNVTTPHTPQRTNKIIPNKNTFYMFGPEKTVKNTGGIMKNIFTFLVITCD